MSENLTEIMTSLDLRDVVKWRVSGHRMTIEWSTTFGLPKFKIVVSTFMENFFETVVKLTGAVALLSTAGNQHQATLAMMTIKPLHLENNHYGDDYWGEGQEIEDLWLSPYGSKTPYASSFTESYDCSKRDMQINKRKLHCSEGRRTDHWCTPYWPCLCGINDGSLKTANWSCTFDKWSIQQFDRTSKQNLDIKGNDATSLLQIGANNQIQFSRRTSKLQINQRIASLSDWSST